MGACVLNRILLMTMECGGGKKMKILTPGSSLEGELVGELAFG